MLPVLTVVSADCAVLCCQLTVLLCRPPGSDHSSPLSLPAMAGRRTALSSPSPPPSARGEPPPQHRHRHRTVPPVHLDGQSPRHEDCSPERRDDYDAGGGRHEDYVSTPVRHGAYSTERPESSSYIEQSPDLRGSGDSGDYCRTPSREGDLTEPSPLRGNRRAWPRTEYGSSGLRPSDAAASPGRYSGEERCAAAGDRAVRRPRDQQSSVGDRNAGYGTDSGGYQSSYRSATLHTSYSPDHPSTNRHAPESEPASRSRQPNGNRRYREPMSSDTRRTVPHSTVALTSQSPGVQHLTHTPVSPQTHLPASPQTHLPASSQTHLPASPQTHLPASPQTRLPASSQIHLPASSQTRLPASSQTHLPASPQTRLPASSQTHLPASPQTDASPQSHPSHPHIASSFPGGHVSKVLNGRPAASHSSSVSNGWSVASGCAAQLPGPARLDWSGAGSARPAALPGRAAPVVRRLPTTPVLESPDEENGSAGRSTWIPR